MTPEERRRAILDWQREGPRFVKPPNFWEGVRRDRAWVALCQCGQRYAGAFAPLNARLHKARTGHDIVKWKIATRPAP